jgi:parvulin-like peptidyl-prolyl isomerase
MTVYGYHIIKVVEVKGEEIKASHILIKTKDFNTWLIDAVSSAKKNILIKTAK